MKIEVNELEPCKLSVHYEANFMEIGDKRAEVENQFKKAPVPGFRPGKGSIEAIRVHYRQQIDDSLKRALAEDAFHNTLFEKKLKAHGPPRFNNLLLDGGKFTCEFELYTKPDFELGQYKDLEVPKPHETLNAIELSERMMQDLRVRLGDVSPYSDGDFVQDGDNVLLDYEGIIDGQKLDNLCATGEMVTIGKSPLQGFDNNLLGMTVGETREFDFVSPEGGLPTMSGKTIHFKATLTMGSKTTPAPLDDELAKKMGRKDFLELQQFVAQQAFARVVNMQKMGIHEAIAKKMVENTTISVPSWMSLSEAQYLCQQSQMDWNLMKDPDKEKLIEVASQNVKLALILDRIRENEPEAQLTDQEVFEVIKQNLANTKTGQNLDEVIQQMNRSGYLQILFSRIKDENTMDFVAKSVRMIE
jgi:trigger factor